MALAYYQPINHSSTNHRAKEELSECMLSDFLRQSIRCGDHIENNHLTITWVSTISSALYQVHWRTQSDMDSAYSLEGEISIYNGRQEGLKEGPNSVWCTVHTWEMFKNIQTGGTQKGTALQGGTRKHNLRTLQVGEDCLWGFCLWLTLIWQRKLTQNLPRGQMVVYKRQHLSQCWALLCVDHICQSHSCAESDRKFLPGKSIALCLKVNQSFQLQGPRIKLGELGEGEGKGMWTLMVDVLTGLHMYGISKMHHWSIVFVWRILLRCGKSWGFCSLGGRRSWELELKLSLGLLLGLKLHVAFVLAHVQCHMGCAQSVQKPPSSLRLVVDRGPVVCRTLLGCGVDLWLGQAGPDNSLNRAPTLEGFAVPLRFYKGKGLNRKQSRAKEPWMDRREAFGLGPRLRERWG